MAIYAFFGVSQAITFFFMGSTFALLTYFASQNLHKVSIVPIRFMGLYLSACAACIDARDACCKHGYSSLM
jgi:hypothetical protein